ncbi:hypothetical protein XENOCAPTIV_030127, partial [Xenoophorus captivus]
LPPWGVVWAVTPGFNLLIHFSVCKKLCDEHLLPEGRSKEQLSQNLILCQTLLNNSSVSRSSPAAPSSLSPLPARSPATLQH